MEVKAVLLETANQSIYLVNHTISPGREACLGRSHTPIIPWPEDRGAPDHTGPGTSCSRGRSFPEDQPRNTARQALPCMGTLAEMALAGSLQSGLCGERAGR